MFNSFGNILRLTSFGESHGKGVGGVIDGFPAGSSTDAAPDSHVSLLPGKKVIKWSFSPASSKENPRAAP